MTKRDAEHIFYLTSLPEWAGLVSFKEERLKRLHGELESCDESQLRSIQGEIKEIKRDFRLRSEAESTLNNARTT